jgi:serine/threonine protein phosphatase PrpC
MPVNHLFSGRTPKESESITDCQDYFEINEAGGCFAISDGASQSFYPAIWAKLLVQHFCEDPEISASNWKAWLEPIQARWLAEVRSRVEAAKSQGKPTWIEGYNGLNAKRSATSTFIGLRFSEDKIKACVVGDSCLFVLRNRNLESYLLTRSEDFNDRPEYFASDPKDNHFQPHFFDIHLNVEQSDQAYLILATDALSEYVIRRFEQKENIFSSLLAISSQEQLERFVASARHQTLRMKNDDVTLLILQYDLSFPHNPSQAPTDTVREGAKLAGNDPQPQTPKPHRTDSTRTRLKQQRAVLIFMLVCLPPLSFWIGKVSSNPNQPTTQTAISSNVIIESIQLPKESIIYADQALTQPLIESLSNPSEVLILEKGDGWIKFQVELYAYRTIINDCPSCSSSEIEILLTKNLRVFPSNSEIDIFGQLNRNKKFQKLQFNSLPDWYKFRFVGYIAK